jgi:hypothetical protein
MKKVNLEVLKDISHHLPMLQKKDLKAKLSRHLQVPTRKKNLKFLAPNLKSHPRNIQLESKTNLIPSRLPSPTTPMTMLLLKSQHHLLVESVKARSRVR